MATLTTDPIDYHAQVHRTAARIALDHANAYPRASDEAEDALQRAAAHTARADVRILQLGVMAGWICDACGWGDCGQCRGGGCTCSRC